MIIIKDIHYKFCLIWLNPKHRLHNKLFLGNIGISQCISVENYLSNGLATCNLWCFQINIYISIHTMYINSWICKWYKVPLANCFYMEWPALTLGLSCHWHLYSWVFSVNSTISSYTINDHTVSYPVTKIEGSLRRYCKMIWVYGTKLQHKTVHTKAATGVCIYEQWTTT